MIIDRPEQQRQRNFKQLPRRKSWSGAEVNRRRPTRSVTPLFRKTGLPILLKAKRRASWRIAESLEGGIIPEPQRTRARTHRAALCGSRRRRSGDRVLVPIRHTSGMTLGGYRSKRQLSQALELVRQQPAGPERASKELSILIALARPMTTGGGMPSRYGKSTTQR
jgi:hypothetical protein